MSSDSIDPQQERRMAPRARLETRATVHLANEQLVCRTHDLSAEGLALVVDNDPVPSGTFMRIQLQLPDERSAIDLDGILVRTDPRSTGIVWGLRFLDCKTTARTSIKRFVRARRSRRHGAGHSSASGDGFTSVGGHPSQATGIQPRTSAEAGTDKES